MAYDIEDVIAQAEEETKKEKKIAYYVAMFIVGKIVLILILYGLYIAFLEKKFHRDIFNPSSTYQTAPVLKA